MTRVLNIFSATAFDPTPSSAKAPAHTGMGAFRFGLNTETNLTALAARSALH